MFLRFARPHSEAGILPRSQLEDDQKHPGFVNHTDRTTMMNSGVLVLVHEYIGYSDVPCSLWLGTT